MGVLNASYRDQSPLRLPLTILLHRYVTDRLRLHRRVINVIDRSHLGHRFAASRHERVRRVIPGFVDTNWRMWNSIARGFANTRPGPFAKSMGALSRVWTPEASTLCVQLACRRRAGAGSPLSTTARI